jgi:hypothetical protein
VIFLIIQKLKIRRNGKVKKQKKQKGKKIRHIIYGVSPLPPV